MAGLLDMPPEAFDPMFGSYVSIEGERPDGKVKGTFAACVFPVASDDPAAAEFAATNARLASVLLKAVGELAWNRPEPPHPGDIVTFEDGGRWSVQKVECFGCGSTDFTLVCRSMTKEPPCSLN